MEEMTDGGEALPLSQEGSVVATNEASLNPKTYDLKIKHNHFPISVGG